MTRNQNQLTRLVFLAVISCFLSPGQPLLAQGPKLRQTLNTQVPNNRCLAFSSDGTTLATLSESRSIKLWNVVTGKSIATLNIGVVQTLAISPNGSVLATSGVGRTIELWDVATSKELLTINAAKTKHGLPDASRNQPVGCLKFSPDGTYLASTLDIGGRPYIRVWDVTTGKNIIDLNRVASGPTQWAFSPDGRTIAVGSGFDVSIYDLATGSEVTFKDRDGYEVAFSPDSKTIAVTHSHKTVIEFIHVPTKKVIFSVKQPIRGMTFDAIAFSPDGKTLASGCSDKSIRFWDTTTGEEKAPLIGVHRGAVHYLAFSKNGQTLVSRDYYGEVKIWDMTAPLVAKRKPDLRTLQRSDLTLEGHTGGIMAVAFSPDGKTLASGSVDKSIKLWDVDTGENLATLQGADWPISSIAYSPDGKTIASAEEDDRNNLRQKVDRPIKVRLWDLVTNKFTSVLEGPPERSGRALVAFSPVGNTIAMLSDYSENSITLLNLTTKKRLSLDGHSDNVVCFAFRKDGKVLASASADKTIMLWDTVNGKHTMILEPPSIKKALVPTSVAFHPNGNILAVGTQGISFWNLKTGRPIESGHSFSDYLKTVRHLAYSPDGKLLGTDSIGVWDVATGRRGQHIGAAEAFSPDGKNAAGFTLGGGSAEVRLVRLWRLPRPK